jgi:CzcA family heavy metal efflux pump
MDMTTEHSSTDSMSWLDKVLDWSLQRRGLVLLASLALLVWGGLSIYRMPVDVLPDLTAPTVVVMTEAHGLSSTEVERLVTIRLESVLNGATNVRRLRSSSSTGFSVVWVEFNWKTDIYRARQIVTERLANVRLPKKVDKPLLAPISSIMGEVMFLALQSDKHSAFTLRAVAERQIRRRLLTVPGVSQVLAMGGKSKQYQILLRPYQLKRYKLTPEQVLKALKDSNDNHSGGWVLTGNKEYAIEGIGRLKGLKDLQQLPIFSKKGVTVRLRDLAAVRIAPIFRRGDGSFNGKPAVILGVQKQPSVNTLKLTKALDKALNSIQASLPTGMKIQRDSFRQSRFISTAINNVQNAMLEGAVLVVIVLMLFLFSWRATLISGLAIPFSVLISLLVLKLLGMSINTMSLGGITVAIGALVDDAVIDVENIFRRLRLNSELPTSEQRPALTVVYEASREIRSSILFATLILMLVFLPLFFLGGMEGRLLQPLGIAYLVAVFASLLVALTMTPVLSYYLLAKRASEHSMEEVRVIRRFKAGYRWLLIRILKRPAFVLSVTGLLLVVSFGLFFVLGRSFLPPFQEGSLTLSVVTMPGTSLKKSSQLGMLVEKTLRQTPEVLSTTRRTGRAEQDEHAMGVYASEIDVLLKMGKRTMPELLVALRKKVSLIPGVTVNFGQPISHRIDHMLSGTRSAIAVKLFGPDFPVLLRKGQEIKQILSKIPGTADVAVEPLVQIPRYRLYPKADFVSRYGLSASALMEQVELSLWGEVATYIFEKQRLIPVKVKLDVPTITNRQQLAKMPIVLNRTVTGPLQQFATIRYSWGPNRIQRESGQRRLIISTNSSQSDLIGLVARIRAGLKKLKLPAGYYLRIDGQFRREEEARKRILLMSIVVFLGIFVLLRLAFDSNKAAVLVLLNLPLALIGGVVSIYLAGQVISIASLVGFIALFGVATRNGIILVSHYQHLLEEGVSFAETVVRGSVERLNPVLMTALTTGLGMLPLLLASGKPGNELQSPIALVMVGGIASATLLNLLVLPVLYNRFFAGEFEGGEQGVLSE